MLHKLCLTGVHFGVKESACSWFWALCQAFLVVVGGERGCWGFWFVALSPLELGQILNFLIISFGILFLQLLCKFTIYFIRNFR